jgi:mono/diheme cytochrome c family protein
MVDRSSSNKHGRPKFSAMLAGLLLACGSALRLMAAHTAEDRATPVSQPDTIDGVRATADGQAQVALRTALSQHVVTMLSGLSPAARRGYQHLTQRPYLPADFDERVMERLVVGVHAKSGTLGEPAVWDTYGLSANPEEPGRALQYVRTESGEYAMNCFACHGGNTFGVSFPGAPNTSYALQSLVEAVRRVKLQDKIPLTHMDIGSVFMPLGGSVGTSNAVMFGVALMNHRDPDLNIVHRLPGNMLHHDMDAPAWWHFSKKKRLYADGFAEKSHRGLMQFMLVRQNGPEKFRRWEAEFRDVFAFLSEVQAPPYSGTIDHDLAARGRIAFEQHCAVCHGEYGDSPKYPELTIPLAEVGTDPVRWQALTREHRRHYGESWFAEYGAQATVEEPVGYVAPPLDGIWASAPYFHNGSVPTLWHVLHPTDRPQVWRRTSIDYDFDKLGMTIDVLDAVPPNLKAEQERHFFDSRRRGKSASGHDFPDALSEQEKKALLEYLKTL